MPRVGYFQGASGTTFPTRCPNTHRFRNQTFHAAPAHHACTSHLGTVNRARTCMGEVLRWRCGMHAGCGWVQHHLGSDRPAAALIQTFRHSDIQTHTTGRQRSWSGLAGHDEFCLCWRLSLWFWLCLLFLRPPPVAACASPLCVHAVLCACRFDMGSIFYCLPRASEVSQEPNGWKA